MDFFSSTKFNQTIYYLTKYFNSAKSFGDDIQLFQKFSNLDEIVVLLQNSLKLLDLIQKYDDQLNLIQKIMQDFSILFDTVPQFNDLKTLVDFIEATNGVLKRLDKLFTMRSLFGETLINVFEKNLHSNFYVEKNTLLNSKLNFQRVNF